MSKINFDKMTWAEKVLLLELVMFDIRMNWNWGHRLVRWWPWTSVKKRKKAAMELARNLGFVTVWRRLDEFNVGDDGRWLRADYTDGGYERMEELHHFKLCHDNRVSIDECRWSHEFLWQCYRIMGINWIEHFNLDI